MYTVFGYPIVRIGGLLVVLGCCAWGEANLEDFPNCDGDVSSIGNSYCDPGNNNEACGWDGEDCCECTCFSNPEQAYSCEVFSCVDPNSGCAEPGLLEYTNCTGDVSFINDGWCDNENNNEACGWDGNDCCECMCIDGNKYDCGSGGYWCLDPNSECTDPRLLKYTNCTGDVSFINDGWCDYETNNEACGWDGKDCCECTCLDREHHDCGSGGYGCLDPNSECTDPSLLRYSNCSGALSWIDNGNCDSVNNIEACGWDGGDCCECTCVDGEFYNCTSSEFFCKDLDSGCTDALVSEYKNCSGDLSFFGDGLCTSENNNEACGWDGGECCECTCEGEPCALNTEYGLFECLDPKAAIKSGSNGCLDWAPALTPCPSQKKQHWIVETSLQAMDLVEALNCSGGIFEVLWIGSITVYQTLLVAGGTVLNVTGVGSNAAIDGRGTAGLFTVSNASLIISSLALLNGSSTSGGAISASGSNVSLSRTKFIGNVATLHGGAVFIAGGSTLTCEEETAFYNNSALHRGGALGASEGSHASWTSGTTFAYNNAVVGGAVDISSKSSALWGGEGETFFFRNQATRDGGGLSVYSDSSVQWEGISIFEGNNANYGWGGGMYVYNARAAWEVEAIFEGNTARFLGGGVFVYNGSASWTRNTSFSDNFAGSFGGAVYGESRTNLSWTGEAFFSSNAASIEGGAVYITDVATASWSAPTIFVNNTASESGGGVALFVGSVASWMGKATFSNNSVSSYNDDIDEIGDGGALYVSSSSTILLGGSTLFSGNVAGGDGGALFIDGRASWEVKTTFAYNVAGNLGGAICMTEGGSSISWSADTLFFNNTAGSGGALVAASELEISGNANTIFLGNSADVYGGAVFIISMDMGPVFYGVRFASNSAQVGGAVYAVTSGTLVTRDLIANEPVENPTSFNSCTFVMNEAYATGGAVSSAAGQDIFLNTTFVRNVAGNGGALQLAGTASIIDCLFEGNAAYSEGGPVVSNIGYLSLVINNTLRGNVLNCEKGLFLHFFEGREEDLWEVLCNGCSTACEGCNIGGTVLVPQCISMSDAGIEHASSIGGVNTIEELNINQGYWRATTHSIYVFRCYTPDACKGGLTGTQDFCEKGYEGPYCSVCSKDYTASLNFECNPCTAWRWGVVIATIVGGVSLVAVIAIVLHLTSGETRGLGRGVVNRVARLIPLQSLKIIVVAWQIVTQFAQVANVTFPDVYQRFLDAVDVLNFEFSWVLSAGCVFNFDFHDHLLIATIGPIVIVLLLGVTFLTAAAKHQNLEATLLNTRHKHVSMVLLVTFLIYSNVSSMIFQMFACEVLDDGKNYLRADYRIECDSAKHQTLQIFAGFMILLYPVGIPLLYAGLLLRDRNLLRKAAERQVSSKVKPTSDLWKPYKPSRFYYEVIECARRISLTGAVVFIYPNTVAQVAVALVITFVFTVLSEALAPYDVGWDCWINRTGHVIVFMSMYIALLLKADVSSERTSSQRLLAFVLVAAHVCMVLAVLIEAVVMAFSATTTRVDEPIRRPAARWQFTWQRNGLNMHGVPSFDGIEASARDAEVESKS